MMRFAAAALIALAAATTATAQTALSLRSTVLVSGDIVRIGDLVEHVAPHKAEIAVFRAPDLGETGSVRVTAVLAALRPHDVVGVNSGSLAEISVTRASRLVGAAEIRGRIAEIAAERLRVADSANIAVAFDGPVPMLHLDPAETGPLMPVRSTFEQRGGKFDMMFRSAGHQVRVTGTAQEAYDAVVLTRPVARGDVLRASDVAVEKRPKTELQGEVLRDSSMAVGMSVQQVLRPGQPLRSTDLAKPQLIKRGESVMLHYEVPGIALTARGKAEDSGSLGDTINVVNIQSKRVVQGVITGPGHVTMTSLAPRIMVASDGRAAGQPITHASTAHTKAE
jgi:flagella basal body P-ring formation protein FlgA